MHFYTSRRGKCHEHVILISRFFLRKCHCRNLVSVQCSSLSRGSFFTVCRPRIGVISGAWLCFFFTVCRHCIGITLCAWHCSLALLFCHCIGIISRARHCLFSLFVATALASLGIFFCHCIGVILRAGHRRCSRPSVSLPGFPVPSTPCSAHHQLSLRLMGDAWIVPEAMGVGVSVVVGVPRDLPRGFS